MDFSGTSCCGGGFAALVLLTTYSLTRTTYLVLPLWAALLLVEAICRVSAAFHKDVLVTAGNGIGDLVELLPG